MMALNLGAMLAMALLPASQPPNVIDANDYIGNFRVLDSSFYDDLTTMPNNTVVEFPSDGTTELKYRNKRPIVVRDKSNITFRGALKANGNPLSRIAFHDAFYHNHDGTNSTADETGYVGIVFVNCTNVTFENLIVHGRGSQQSSNAHDYGVCGLMLSGCSGSTISNCEFRDLGGTEPSGPKPGGCHLAIVATEAAFNGMTAPTIKPLVARVPNHLNRYRASGVECINNQIVDCVFRDIEGVAERGIWLYTNWELGISGTALPHDQYNATVSGTAITGCEFFGGPQGGFDESAVELMGPGTVSNTVDGCTLNHTRNGTLSCTGGARENLFIRNDVESVFPKGGLLNDVSQMAFAMRDSGILKSSWSVPRTNYRNKFEDNTVKLVEGAGRLTGGVFVDRSTELCLDDNEFHADFAVTNGVRPCFLYLSPDVHLLRLVRNVVKDPGIPALPWRYFRKDETSDALVTVVNETVLSTGTDRQPVLVSLYRLEDPTVSVNTVNHQDSGDGSNNSGMAGGM